MFFSSTVSGSCDARRIFFMEILSQIEIKIYATTGSKELKLQVNLVSEQKNEKRLRITILRVDRIIYSRNLMSFNLAYILRELENKSINI